MPFYRFIIFITALVFFSLAASGTSQGSKGLQSPSQIDKFEKLVIFYRYQNPDSATYYAKAGLKLARATNNEEGIARMLTQMGMIEDNTGNPESSRQRYLEALEIYKRLKIPKGIIKENIRLGVVENRKGNAASALSYFLQALKVSEKSNDKAGIMEANVTMGEVYATQRNYAKSIYYNKIAEQVGESLPFSSLKLNICLNLGTSYRESGDYKTAIHYFQKGIDQSNYPEMMGLNISLTNGLAQVYHKMGNLNKAIELQKGALSKSRNIRNSLREFQSLMALAESYSNLDHRLSLQYLNKALILGETSRTNKQILEALTKITALYERLGDYKQAYATKSKQYSIADSFYFKAISNKIADLQARYELNKSQARVDQLKFLNSKQALEKRIILAIAIASLVLLFVLAGYFYKISKLNSLLNQTNAALVESNRVKDKLFSVLAHDLRGPLASVLNLIGLVNRGWLSEEEKQLMMVKLEAQCNVSMETLSLLLRWGQMQIKGVMINQTDIDPARAVTRVIALLENTAAQKSITIESAVENELRVSCDPDHLDFLLRNLLSNAIKFTPEGGNIWVSVKQNGENKVLFKVKDTGVGIAPERLEAIFNVNNVSTNGTNNEKGTSLGLIISKEFIVANDGKIWVESEPGKGSDFYFTLKSR